MQLPFAKAASVGKALQLRPRLPAAVSPLVLGRCALNFSQLRNAFHEEGLRRVQPVQNAMVVTAQFRCNLKNTFLACLFLLSSQRNHTKSITARALMSFTFWT